jgi:beta-phosphoglucomutase-like phosphatase (HAD superfamily)
LFSNLAIPLGRWASVLNAPVSADLVIFDCDGVLVDTEPVSNRVMAGAISEAGLPMTTEEVSAAFEGMRLDDIAAEVEMRLGKKLPARPLASIDAARIWVCVASQASREKVELTLGLSA